MKKARRTEITIETEEILVIRRVGKISAATWCPDCPNLVRMVSPDEAAALTSVSLRTVYRWVESATGHTLEASDGRLLICPRSFYSDHPALSRPGEP